MDLNALNELYAQLSVEQRLQRLYQDFNDVLITSSFGTTSAVLLHYISGVKPGQPIHFIDTTYHFQETLDYRDELSRYFNLPLVNLEPDRLLNNFTKRGRTWRNNPDLCCTINKVHPVEQILPKYDVWVSGVMGYHNINRSNKNVFEYDAKGWLKCYPLIDLSREEVSRLYRKHDFPRHPLQDKGYDSIGCINCTVKGKGRQGRWPDSSKLECGLHQTVG